MRIGKFEIEPFTLFSIICVIALALLGIFGR
jgi:hypothetical protein